MTSANYKPRINSSLIKLVKSRSTKAFEHQERRDPLKEFSATGNVHRNKKYRIKPIYTKFEAS